VAIVLLLNLLLAWLQHRVTPQAFPFEGRAIPNPVAQLGIGKAALLSQQVWHGVSIRVIVALPASAGRFGDSILVGFTAALMLGLAIAGYLLYRVGKWVAARETGSGWLSGLRGLQIALLYAAVMFVLGLIARTDISLAGIAEIREGPRSVSLEPSLLGAFWLPFLLASLAAGAGAVSGKLRPRERLARLAVAGVAGGWGAAWLAVALASIAFLIVAALNPEVTRAYLELVSGGGLAKALLVVTTLLFLPNAGTGIAAAAMGGSINFVAAGDSCAVISFLRFPGGFMEPGPVTGLGEACGIPVALGPAPFQYLLFLLVPLAATIAGGWLAARRSGATEAEEGAIAGAAIAIPFALSTWVLALMARLGYVVGPAALFAPFEVRVWIGPGLLSTVLVALVWGVAGGAIGGAIASSRAGAGGKPSGPGIDPGPPASDSTQTAGGGGAAPSLLS
jgi:hypothetical protein